MPVSILNAKHSFVKFDDLNAPVMPVVAPDDYAFQMICQCSSIAETNEILGADIFLMLVKPNAVITSAADLPANLIFDYSDAAYGIQVLPYRISDTQILLYWPHGMPDINTLPDESCFRFVLQIGASSGSLQYFLSNIFKKVDEKFTSALEYYCEEDSYDFNYCPDSDIVNRSRVPLYLLKPQFTDDESVYFKSNGQAQVLRSLTRKVYEGIVDYCTEDLHIKIKIALSHDSVQINNEQYSGGIAKNGPYEIDWPEIPGYSKMAIAKFKANATPYDVRNDNCATCNAYVCEIVTIAGEFNLPNGNVGVPYSYEVALGGTPGFERIIENKPAWMTISIDGDKLKFSGTPTELGTGIYVAFIVINCGGQVSDNDDFNVTE